MILGLSSPVEESSPESWGRFHREAGSRAVVFPLNCQAKQEDIDAYLKAARDNALIIAEVGVWKNTLAADKAERNAAIKYAIGQLELAEYLNAKCCVNIIGTPHGTVWDGAYKENFSKETWEAAIHMIQEIIDAVKPKNTKYSIETMPWMYPSSPDEYVRMIDEVARDGFGVHMDMVNMINCPDRYFFAEEFMEECFEKLSGKILSCHLKDIYLKQEYTFQLKECACGEGTLNLEKYAELASKENREMPMIIEHLGSNQEYIDSLKYVKNRLAQYLA